MDDSNVGYRERPVIKAIAEVMTKVGSVEKKGRNKFHGYDYATAADIAHALQRTMSAAGLVIVPTQQRMEIIDDGNVLSIEFAFTVIHTSGDMLDEKPVFTGMSGCRNSKGGFDDKSANKCLTAASKYFVLHLFKIPTGDYQDADGAEDQQRKSNGPDARQAPPKAQQQANTKMRKLAQTIKTSLEGAMFASDVDAIMDSEGPTLSELPDKTRSYLVKAAQDRKAALEAQT